LVFTVAPPASARSLSRLAQSLLRSSLVKLMLSAGAIAQSGCLLNQRVNEPPEVTVQKPDVVYFNSDVTFTASVKDADEDRVDLAWRHADGVCPPDFAPSSWPTTPASAGSSFDVNAGDAPSCVWVFATDSHGAVTVDHFPLEPVDRAPTLDLKVVSPTQPAVTYPLYTAFELAAVGADPDGDGLSTTWAPLAGPDGSSAMLAPCTRDGHQCFTANVPGTYKVSATVKEEIGARGPALASAPQSLTLVVAPDALPCLGETSPALPTAGGMLLSAPDEDRTFQVLAVQDDGDPFPSATGGTTSFRWSVTDPALVTTIAPPSFTATYWLRAGLFQVGDTVYVRLDIKDRGSETRTLATCHDTDPFCEDPLRPGCLQRVTWKVVYGLPPGGQP